MSLKQLSEWLTGISRLSGDAPIVETTRSALAEADALRSRAEYAEAMFRQARTHVEDQCWLKDAAGQRQLWQCTACRSQRGSIHAAGCVVASILDARIV